MEKYLFIYLFSLQLDSLNFCYGSSRIFNGFSSSSYLMTPMHFEDFPIVYIRHCFYARIIQETFQFKTCRGSLCSPLTQPNMSCTHISQFKSERVCEYCINLRCPCTVWPQQRLKPRWAAPEAQVLLGRKWGSGGLAAATTSNYCLFQMSGWTPIQFVPLECTAIRLHQIFKECPL